VNYFFGNKKHQVFPDRDKQIWSAQESVITTAPFKTIAQLYTFNNILFPHQVHGTVGLVITRKDNYITSKKSFTQDADWLITNIPTLGIGILTADCVPLLLHDPVAAVVGAVHAGWRGATEGVVISALTNMMNAFGTSPKNVQVYIGPHARTCCYQVDKPFYENVMQKQWGTTAWLYNRESLFFDLHHCCIEQLYAVGITQSQIQSIRTCTVCNSTYCSYRRDKERAGRNISCIGIN
jgi:polyphenol oxidase